MVENGRLRGMLFDVMEYDLDERGRILDSRVTGERTIFCDDVMLAIGQDNAFPWIERDLGIEFDQWDVPVVDETTFQSTRPGVFFGGDSAFGPKNIIWAVEHGHQAAVSIHRHCHGEALEDRLPVTMNLSSRKMGIHEWSLHQRLQSRRAAPDAARGPQRAFPQARHRGRAGFQPPNRRPMRSSAV